MKLSLIELRIMNIIYSNVPEISCGDSLKCFNEKYSYDWKLSTYSTYLKRLSQKGYLQNRSWGNIRYYSPVLDRHSFCLEQLSILSEPIFSNDYKELSKCVQELYERGTLM